MHKSEGTDTLGTQLFLAVSPRSFLSRPRKDNIAEETDIYTQGKCCSIHPQKRLREERPSVLVL
jgi:hypothetical protein